MVRNNYIDNNNKPKTTGEVRISLKKVREIGLKYWSLSGKVTSIKTNKFVSFESSLERDLIYHLEFDSNVKLYTEQPIRMYYEIDRLKTFYVPDFYVEYFDKTPNTIIEVKYQKDLKENRKKLKAKFSAAREFSLKNNLEFKILSEKEIRNDKLLNIKFLLDYRNPNIDVNYEMVDKICDYLTNLDSSTPKKLLKDISTDQNEKAQLLYVLWYSIANGFVKINLDQKINMNSEIFKSEL